MSQRIITILQIIQVKGNDQHTWHLYILFYPFIIGITVIHIRQHIFCCKLSVEFQLTGFVCLTDCLFKRFLHQNTDIYKDSEITNKRNLE